MLRYAGCRSVEEELLQPLRACIEEVRNRLSYKVCYMQLPLLIKEESCDFGIFTVHSADLAKNLAGCKEVVLFAATIGVEIDRLIAKYTSISPSKAVLLQAIGAERIECLCDVFCEEIAQEMQMGGRPRFSPGYGDVDLEIQREIVTLLDCTKRIGVSLNDSLLMSPSKSVTAFMGLKELGQSLERRKTKGTNKCASCAKIDCNFRGV